jgi:PAS domain S-box-containing protein
LRTKTLFDAFGFTRARGPILGEPAGRECAASEFRYREGLMRAAFLFIVIATGLTVLAWSAVDVVRRPPGTLWVLLLVFTVIAAYVPLRMPGFPVSMSLAETFTMTAAVLLGPAPAAIAVACDALVISYRLVRENRTMTRVLFNMSASALSMWTAAVVFHRTPASASLHRGGSGLWLFALWVFAFAGIYFAMNSSLVAGAVVVGRNVSWRRVWQQQFLPLWIVYGVGAAVAALLIIAISPATQFGVRTAILPLLLLCVPAFARLLGHLKRRSQALSDLRTYVAALRSTADAVVLTNRDGLLTFINPAGERLTGWTSSEALGRHFDEVERSRPVADEHSGETVETTLTARDGTSRDIEQTRATIRDEDGTVIGTIATLRDIGGRKLIEAAREQAFSREQEARVAADRANRTKDEFLATLSHELRTPAATIAGWTRLLTSGRLDPSQTAQALEAVERSARAQTATLNDLLDVSRIVRGALRLEIRRVDVAQVLKEVLETIEPAREAKQIALTVTLEGNLLIDADGDRLRQVFWNLVSNAVKFTDVGGWIRLEARRSGDVLRAEVADGGCGIDPAFLPYVFDRFRQADQSPTREHGGLGLGLAIVRSIIEAHGGTVSVSSDGLGRGACFEISLPASVREPPTNAD